LDRPKPVREETQMKLSQLELEFEKLRMERYDEKATRLTVRNEERERFEFELAKLQEENDYNMTELENTRQELLQSNELLIQMAEKMKEQDFCESSALRESLEDAQRKVLLAQETSVALKQQVIGMPQLRT
jgi:hypothetical protein